MTQRIFVSGLAALASAALACTSPQTNPRAEAPAATPAAQAAPAPAQPAAAALAPVEPAPVAVAPVVAAPVAAEPVAAAPVAAAPVAAENVAAPAPRAEPAPATPPLRKLTAVNQVTPVSEVEPAQAAAAAQQATPPQPAAPAVRAPSAFDVALRASRDALRIASAGHMKSLADGIYSAYFAALAVNAPQRESDAAQALAYGEALWPFDPALAARSHARAFELAPDEAAVVVAHARALQLKGDHAGAVPLYARALELGYAPDVAFHALRADALLCSGDTTGAVQVWQRAAVVPKLSQLERDEARPGPSRTPRPAWYLEAERDLRAIHGLPWPERTRYGLIRKLKDGDNTLFEDLIITDCFWNGTHDFANSNRAYLKRDLAFALERLGKDPATTDGRRYIELEYFAGARMRIEPNAIHDMAEAEAAMPENSMSLPPSNIERGGKKLGFVGSKKNKHFPVSSRLAPLIYRVLFMDGVTISVEWLDLFSDELAARPNSEQGDVDIAVFVLDLYREAIDRKFPTWEPMPARREVFEKEMWARYKDVRIAQRIVGRHGKELASENPVLVEALKLFPADLELATAALEAVRRENKPQREPLIRVAKAALAEGKLNAASAALVQLLHAPEK